MARASGETSYVGSLVGTGLKFGIVVGRFNDLVTKLLLEGALDHFERHGVSRAEVDVRKKSAGSCLFRCCRPRSLCWRPNVPCPLSPAGRLGSWQL